MAVGRRLTRRAPRFATRCLWRPSGATCVAVGGVVVVELGLRPVEIPGLVQGRALVVVGIYLALFCFGMRQRRKRLSRTRARASSKSP